MTRVLTAIALVFLFCPLPSSADKTDIVILKNGDRITGEIKRLQARLLEFNTDAAGTIVIEWRYIERVISTENQSVDTTDGRRYLGKLTSVDQSDAIGLQTESELVELDPDKIFSAWPVKASFWDRSDFDISLGFDYQKSTDITNLSLASDWQHRRFDRLTEASLRTNITLQESGEDQKRTQAGVSHQYFHANRRFNAWLANAESNESLGLDFRVLAGGVHGKYLLRESNRWLSMAAGLVASRENYSMTETVDSLEGVVNSQFNLYRYADPERSLVARLSLYPSLTESGRLRSDFRTTFKLELVKDFYWSMEFYHQNDSKPPSENAIKTDYGITTSLGWSP